jgi:glycolate oxidase FAD binding subunit
LPGDGRRGDPADEEEGVMASTANAHLGQDLASLLGAENVCEETAPLTAFAVDGVKPSVWVTPGSAEEVAAIIRLANERKLSVVAAGGFTQQSMGKTPSPIDILVRTDRLNRVLHFDPGDLTIGVEAGCKVTAVREKVAAESLLLPVDVPNPQLATIGGVLATGAAGPLKHGFGGAREYCIGVSFVTGDGRIAKAGGRVVKNVAGYDLMKLMIGSQGTLGVITSANLKLFAAPKQTRTFLAAFESTEAALEYRDFVQRSPLSPMCLEMISPRAHAYIGSKGESWSIVVRGAGSEAVLVRFGRELGDCVARELIGDDEASFWLGVQEFSSAVRKRHQNAMTATVHTASSELSAFLRAAERSALDQNMLFAAVGRAAVASIDAAFIPLSVDPPAAMQYARAIADLRNSLPEDSAVMVTRCPREAKAYFSVWGETSGDIEAMRAVKQALDPNGILNRGRFLF